MESVRESVETKQSPTTSKPESPIGDGGLVRTQSTPIGADTEKRNFEHDSLVTVRLTGPPSLLINTSIPPNPLPTRKTVYGLDYTPTGTIEESAEEGVDGSESDSESETQTVASVEGLGLNLQEELEEELEEPSTQETGVVDLEASEGRSSEESETVDWDTLQKKEDLESKDQDSDKVCGGWVVTFPLGPTLTRIKYSLPRCSSPDSSKKMRNSQ